MRIYLLNNIKPYSEDEDGYSGEWFNCPADFEEIKEKLEEEMSTYKTMRVTVDNKKEAKGDMAELRKHVEKAK